MILRQGMKKELVKVAMMNPKFNETRDKNASHRLLILVMLDQALQPGTSNLHEWRSIENLNLNYNRKQFLHITARVSYSPPRSKEIRYLKSIT